MSGRAREPVKRNKTILHNLPEDFFHSFPDHGSNLGLFASTVPSSCQRAYPSRKSQPNGRRYQDRPNQTAGSSSLPGGAENFPGNLDKGSLSPLSFCAGGGFQSPNPKPRGSPSHILRIET